MAGLRNRSHAPKYAVCLLSLGLLMLTGMSKEGFAFPISINTTALNGTAARLDFVLFDGDITANNSATISGLITNGTLQGTDCSVSCTGGPPFIINDGGGFGEFVQDLILGTALSFNLTSTANFAGGDPDLLILNLLDQGTNFTLVDTNLDALSAPVPFQDALLVLNLRNGLILTPSTSSPAITITAPSNATIPEPSNLLLFMAGSPVVVWRLMRRPSFD